MEQKKDKFLEIDGLRVEYHSGGQVIHAVNGISLSLEKGRSLGLVGETGAGKTTVAKSILRILPDRGARVTAGEIRLDGRNLLTLSENEMMKIRGNDIAMVFQDPMTALNPTMRVGSQISEVVLHHNDITRAEAEKRAVEMLELVGIPGERFNEYPHQFSGGMKQRVVIAMALACNPALLLADEPTTALDVTIQAQVLDMMEDLKKRLDTSLVLITHDMGVVATICDDVAIMYAGQIVEYGTKEAIFDNPSHPDTIGLFNAIPSMNVDEEYLHPIDGLPPDPSDLPKGCHFSPRCSHSCKLCFSEEAEYVEVEKGHYVKCHQCCLETMKERKR